MVEDPLRRGVCYFKVSKPILCEYRAVNVLQITSKRGLVETYLLVEVRSNMDMAVLIVPKPMVLEECCEGTLQSPLASRRSFLLWRVP